MMPTTNFASAAPADVLACNVVRISAGTKISDWKVKHVILTLNVGGPSYLGLTGSISWLLMPWLLTSPGHHQPWYWLRRKGRFLSYLRKDFNCVVSMWRNDTQCQYMFMFPLKNLARKGLKVSVVTNDSVPSLKTWWHHPYGRQQLVALPIGSK